MARLICYRSTTIEEKESTKKKSNSRSGGHYVSIIWNKKCWVLGESNRKLYVVLK